jgi:hypothetical protein
LLSGIFYDRPPRDTAMGRYFLTVSHGCRRPGVVQDQATNATIEALRRTVGIVVMGSMPESRGTRAAASGATSAGVYEANASTCPFVLSRLWTGSGALGSCERGTTDREMDDTYVCRLLIMRPPCPPPIGATGAGRVPEMPRLARGHHCRSPS